MRLFTFLVALLLSVAWVVLLDRPLGAVPAIGKLLDPINGFWANAEPVKEPMPAKYAPPVKGLVKVSFDERLVPHVTAPDDEALYFEQGYLHAYYRLWQMDMQTRAAAGRISEVVGEKAFEFDRRQRRKGMVWAAENSLKAMEADPVTKNVLDAYTKGVNSFISGLNYRDYPLEYKLMGFIPEPWTNLKCALLLKYMADDLTGSVDDIAMSYLRNVLPPAEMDDLFPDKIANSQPVIPAGTAFAPASLRVPPAPSGALFARFDTTLVKQDTAKKTAATFRSASGIGSNNWALGSSLTADGSAILCNDPHLGLNLPSIWYELQLTAPGINCYGVSIPGAPGIIIGFNDSISWGFTNNYRDVKDYYEIKTEDPRLYYFDGKEVPFNERHEVIRIKGKEEPFVDIIRFTIHGPVMYDEHFPEPSGSGKTLAMTWMAHRSTNELLSVYLYNRARNYPEFVTGIQRFECPGQNFVYADRQGNIAMWGQGRFINKWKDQGKYVMRGDISATLWGDTIPMNENPHVFNPAQGYVASANQAVTDNTYPYWYNGDFTEFRSWEINYKLIEYFIRGALEKKKLAFDYKTLPYGRGKLFVYSPACRGMDATPPGKALDMENNMRMQTSNESALNTTLLSIAAIRDTMNYDSSLEAELLDPDSKGASLFQIFWYNLYKNIWQDDFRNFPDKLYPSAETMQLLLNDSTSRYYDDVTTASKEGLADMVRISYKQATDSLKILKKTGGTEWYKVKNTSVMHLTKIPAFSYEHLKTGGWGNTINAMKQNHGPSWRMIVRMSKDKVEARVVYPGGQSGNPGSKYYATFLDHWVYGHYYTVQLDDGSNHKK